MKQQKCTVTPPTCTFLTGASFAVKDCVVWVASVEAVFAGTHHVVVRDAGLNLNFMHCRWHTHTLVGEAKMMATSS